MFYFEKFSNMQRSWKTSTKNIHTFDQLTFFHICSIFLYTVLFKMNSETKLQGKAIYA